MAKQDRKRKEKTTDTRFGSLSYNRLEMQVSQVFHLAIELFDSLDYLLVLDHEDDITLYDDEESGDIVSFYQMKTNDESISITTALSSGWISKLYSKLQNPERFVRELALITNCSLKLSSNKPVSAGKTPFTSFDPDSKNKICENIAKQLGIPVDEVDLTKLFHMRTTLSIDAHAQLVEKEATDFLFEHFADIKVHVVKTIVSAVFQLLAEKQRFERLSETASFAEQKEKKGFAKSTFRRIIQSAIKMNIPEFEFICRAAHIPEEEKGTAAVAYTSVSSDCHRNSGAFASLFQALDMLVDSNPVTEGEKLWDYAKRCKSLLAEQQKKLSIIYSDPYYIEVLALCIWISTGGI